jgi:hypothetical protein
MCISANEANEMPEQVEQYVVLKTCIVHAHVWGKKYIGLYLQTKPIRITMWMEVVIDVFNAESCWRVGCNFIEGVGMY